MLQPVDKLKDSRLLGNPRVELHFLIPRWIHTIAQEVVLKKENKESDNSRTRVMLNIIFLWGTGGWVNCKLLPGRPLRISSSLLALLFGQPFKRTRTYLATGRREKHLATQLSNLLSLIVSLFNNSF